MPAVSKRQILKACKSRGWTLQPAALEGLQVALEVGNDLSHLLDAVAPHMTDAKLVTAAIWNQVVEAQQNHVEQDHDNDDLEDEQEDWRVSRRNDEKEADLQVISAFETPKLSYDVMRKQFRVSEETKSLFGTAQDKVDMLSQRYALIQQRILRHQLFRPTDFGGVTHKITPIESLLGKRSTHSLLLLGILVQLEEGRYYLEDPTGIVPLVLSQAQPVDGFYVTEHCILLVEGYFGDSLLHVHRLGPPLLEERPVTLRAMQQQVSHPHYQTQLSTRNNSLLQNNDKSEAFCVLSDVHLDRPKVLQQLEALFAGYTNYRPHNLPCFVLMGHFSSTPVSYRQLEALLEELQGTLRKFSVLSHAHVVLVPGPGESGHVLPLPPLKSSSNADTAHWHWASNPCRIRWAAQEMVIFRHDLLPLLQQEQVLSFADNRADNTTQHEERDDDSRDKDDDDHAPLPLHCRLIKTILDQGHLIPVAGTPIFWNYDHALSLYPLPTVLVLGGQGCQAFFETYGGCDVLHPGSWAQSGSYAVYNNNNKLDDADQMLDDEEEEDASPVQLLQMGDLDQEGWMPKRS